MSPADLVLVSMFLVLPLGATSVVVALTTRPRMPTILRGTQLLLLAAGAVLLLTWIVLRLATFGYWMSGVGPEPAALGVARVIGLVVAVIAWVVLVISVATLVVGSGRGWRRPSQEGAR